MADTDLRVRFKHPYKTEAEWEAITTIPKTGEALYTKTGPREGWYKIGDGVHQWKDLLYIKPSYTLAEIAPIATATYSGLYGSTNDAGGASFYFMTVKPTTYYVIWKVRYRIHCWVPNQQYYDSYSDVEIWGYQSTYSGYKIFNNHSYEGSSIRRCFYFHNLYRATQTGSTAYGHAIGLGLRASTNPTSSSYPRSFTVDVLEVENCEINLFADAIKYASIPGTGSTNYAALSEFDGYNVGLRESGDDNDTYTVRNYYTQFIAGANGMKQYSLVMEDADGKWQSFTTDNGTGTTKTKNPSGFKLNQVYYMSMGGNVNAGNANGNGIVSSYVISVDFRYSSNCGFTLIAKEPVFIKGTYDLNTNLFYLADIWWTQNLPTSFDGYVYKQIGYAVGTCTIDFNNNLPTYWFHDGAIREFVVPVATPLIAGLLSSDDKIKLNTIENGANKCIAITNAEIDAIMAT